MSNAPVLALPDFSKPFTTETDASSKGMEEVSQQNGLQSPSLLRHLNVGITTYWSMKRSD